MTRITNKWQYFVDKRSRDTVSLMMNALLLVLVLVLESFSLTSTWRRFLFIAKDFLIHRMFDIFAAKKSRQGNTSFFVLIVDKTPSFTR